MTENNEKHTIILWENERYPIENTYDICFVLSIEYLLLQKFDASETLPLQPFDTNKKWEEAAINFTAGTDKAEYLLMV